MLRPGRRTEPERKPKTRINRFLLLNPNRNLYNLIEANLTWTWTQGHQNSWTLTGCEPLK